MKRAICLGGFVFALLLSRSVRAECDVPHRGCFAAETLRLQPGIADFTTVGPTEITHAIDAGMWVVYGYGQVRITTPSPGITPQTTYQGTGHTITPTFFLRVPIRRAIELYGLWGTGIHTGSGDSALSGGAPTNIGFHSPRVGFAMDLGRTLEVPLQWLARFDMSIPIGKSADFFGEPNVVFVPSMVLQGNYGLLSFAGSVDIRIRPRSNYLNLQIGTELGASAGLGVRIIEGLSVAIEYRNVIPFAPASVLHEIHETVTLRRWKIAITANYSNGFSAVNAFGKEGSGARSPIHRAILGVSIPLDSNL